MCDGKAAVFAKSIIQTPVLPVQSCTNSRELPTTCGDTAVRKHSTRSNVYKWSAWSSSALSFQHIWPRVLWRSLTFPTPGAVVSTIWDSPTEGKDTIFTREERETIYESPEKRQRISHSPQCVYWIQQSCRMPLSLDLCFWSFWNWCDILHWTSARAKIQISAS